jgi:hypothetical protein
VNAIRIRKTVDSETLHLPELRPLIGRQVEIIVLEETSTLPPGVRPGHGDWDAAERAVQALEDYDFDAWREQREIDRKHANDHLP